MSAWIISISDDFADHWDIAAEHGGWDLRRDARIQPGDDVFFRVSKGNFAGWVRATSATRPTVSSPIIPWRNRIEGGYTHRFTFDTVSTAVLRPSTWADIKAATGTREVPNKPVRFDDPAQQAALRAMFAGSAPRTQPDIARALPGIEVGYEHVDTDARRRVVSAVVQRRGQAKFRRSLLAAYGGACAITGSTAEPVLEAAHIDSYAGDHTQHVTNGLLLRSDLHTLFDLHLITVTAGKLLAVSPQLRGTEYAAFNRRRLNLPAVTENHPDKDALQRHRSLCTWYVLVPVGER